MNMSNTKPKVYYDSLSELLVKSLSRALQDTQVYIAQLNLLKNENSRKIIDILDSEGELTIHEIQRKIGLKTYNNAFLNVKRLLNTFLVTARKDNLAQGRPVYVSLSIQAKLLTKKYSGQIISRLNKKDL